MAMNRFFYIFVTKHKQQPMIMKEIYVAGEQSISLNK